MVVVRWPDGGGGGAERPGLEVLLDVGGMEEVVVDRVVDLPRRCTLETACDVGLVGEELVEGVSEPALGAGARWDGPGGEALVDVLGRPGW